MLVLSVSSAAVDGKWSVLSSFFSGSTRKQMDLEKEYYFRDEAFDVDSCFLIIFFIFQVANKFFLFYLTMCVWLSHYA